MVGSDLNHSLRTYRGKQHWKWGLRQPFRVSHGAQKGLILIKYDQFHKIWDLVVSNVGARVGSDLNHLPRYLVKKVKNCLHFGGGDAGGSGQVVSLRGTFTASSCQIHNIGSFGMFELSKSIYYYNGDNQMDSSWGHQKAIMVSNK